MLLPMLNIYQEYVRNHHYSLQVSNTVYCSCVSLCINRLCAILQMDHHRISSTDGSPSFVLWFSLIFPGYSNLFALLNHCYNLSSFTSITAQTRERVEEKENQVHRFEDLFWILFSVRSCFLYSCCLPRVIYIYINFSLLIFSLRQNITLFLLLNHSFALCCKAVFRDKNCGWFILTAFVVLLVVNNEFQKTSWHVFLQRDIKWFRELSSLLQAPGTDFSVPPLIRFLRQADVQRLNCAE